MRKNKFINQIIVCSMTVMMLTFASTYSDSVHAQDANYDTDMATGAETLKGTDGDLTWSITSAGKLTISGTGNPIESPWNNYNDQIKTATLKVKDFTSASGFVSGCSNLTSVDLTQSDFSKCTNISGMFSYCLNLKTIKGIEDIDTGNVTGMWGVFGYCGIESLDLSKWNVQNVTDCSHMFECATKLKTLNLKGWKAKNLTEIAGMFEHCESLKSVDVSGLNTSNVTDMYSTFMYCGELENISGLDKWNTRNVRSMYMMFQWCEKLKSLDVSGFDTSNVTDMLCMFEGCLSVKTLDVRSFNTANVTNMRSIFSNMQSLETLQMNTDTFVTDKVTDMGGMFFDTYKLKKLDVSKFNTENVTSMEDMFYGARTLTALDVSGFDTSKVTNMALMFADMPNLKSLDVTGFDTSNVTNMNGTFSGCSSLTKLDISNFDTSKVTCMTIMFSDMPGLTSIDVSGLDTTNVTEMTRMFSGCSKLTKLDVSNFKTSKVTGMMGMFSYCSSLKCIDISMFDYSSVEDMFAMFTHSSGLKEIKLGRLNAPKIKDMSEMFGGCTSLESISYSDVNISTVTDMSYMFILCSSLKFLDMSSFDLKNLTSVEYMFSEASELQEIDTPKNLSVLVELPAKYYDNSGKSYTSLPMNEGKSIHISSNNTVKYQIIFDGNKATGGSMKAQTIKYGTGTGLKANAYKRKGYEFAGWNTKQNGTGTTYADKADGSKLSKKNGAKVRLYAQWKLKNYKITYKLNGGTNVKENRTKYNVNTKTINLKNPKRKGYVFKGWYTDAGCKKRIRYIKKGSTGNKILYAKWAVRR